MRRCKQNIGTFQETVLRNLIDRIYENLPGNDDLLDELRGLGLKHDKEILIDAVEIQRKDGIDTLVALDSDITEKEQGECINDAIRDVEDESLVLVMTTPERI